MKLKTKNKRSDKKQRNEFLRRFNQHSNKNFYLLTKKNLCFLEKSDKEQFLSSTKSRTLISSTRYTSCCGFDFKIPSLLSVSSLFIPLSSASLCIHCVSRKALYFF